MPLDSSATKARILEAAFREFARHGLAGARVDRIAAAAKANKRAIYTYFGDKEDLFDITLVAQLGHAMNEPPRRWDNLPEFAGLIFDYFRADPDRMRIQLWRQLERPAPLPGELEAYQRSMDQMAAAQPASPAWKTTELYSVIWAQHFSWFLAPSTLLEIQRSAPGEGAARRQREVTVEAVRRLTDDQR